MKVFISWSGEESKRIAETLKEWIKYVIQSVEPFVSSEDIHKGERWSNDIAKELEETNFGILCVTKDNYKAPWLLFEAGALSKAMDKALVAPLLFNLRHSDLTGSPLLQFQTTPFTKDEIKKLVYTINEKCVNKLDDIDKVFEKWYPDLEESLKKILKDASENDEVEENETSLKSQVLEEILSLSRDNQKLLKNSENRTSEEHSQVVKMLERIYNPNEKNDEYLGRKRRLNPMYFEELFHKTRMGIDNYYAFLIILSLYKNDFPWLYDIGKELVDVLKSSKSKKQKEDAIVKFKEMLKYTEQFTMRFHKQFEINKDYLMLYRELPMLLMRWVEEVEINNS